MEDDIDIKKVLEFYKGCPDGQYDQDVVTILEELVSLKFYAVFCYDSYYPSGGVSDMHDELFASKAEAIAYAETRSEEWREVVFTPTMDIVWDAG